MAETFAVRLSGGPLDGTYTPEADPAEFWPPPARIETSRGRGRYERVSYSQLTEASPGVLRGAEYRWRATEGGETEP